MIKNYSHLNTREAKYLWIIEEFTDFCRYLNNGYRIISDKFDVDGNEEQRFNLKMVCGSEYISFTFEWPQQSCKDMMVGQLSILDKNNEKFKSIEIQIDPEKVKNKELSTLKIEKNDLFFRTLDVFPDNNLKVSCNLKIFIDINHNTCPFNIRKNYLSITDHLKKLLDSQNGSDVVCEVDGKELKLHKSILMARSPVFSAMFNNDMIENNSNRVKIEDISSSVFKLLMEFIYTDEITAELDVETGIDLLKAASKYQLDGLEVLCEVKLCNLLTIHNAMEILAVAELHNCDNLVKSIKNFINNHQIEIQTIVKPEHFLKHPHHVSLFLTKDIK